MDLVACLDFGASCYLILLDYDWICSYLYDCGKCGLVVAYIINWHFKTEKFFHNLSFFYANTSLWLIVIR